MIARFEVSQIRFDGGVRWLGAVETIEKAHDRVKQSSRQDSKNEPLHQRHRRPALVTTSGLNRSAALVAIAGH